MGRGCNGCQVFVDKITRRIIVDISPGDEMGRGCNDCQVFVDKIMSEKTAPVLAFHIIPLSGVAPS
jgi:hypothetical protein